MSDSTFHGKQTTKASLGDRIALITLHVGLFVLAEALTWHWTQSLAILEHRGVHASATVIYKGMTSGRGSHPFIVYEYEVGKDSIQRHSESIYSDDYAQVNLGEKVPIVFDPQKAGRARLVWHGAGPGGNYLFAFILLSLVWIIIAAFSFGFTWISATIAPT